jgi:hypothetical protein
MTPFLDSHRYNWREDASGCYVWLGATSGTNGRRPYARDPRTKKYISVPRIVCEEVNGPCPDGEEVRHRCWTTLCIRDDHLHWGTHAQNVADGQ